MMPDKTSGKEYVRIRGENKSRGLKKGQQPGPEKVFCGIYRRCLIVFQLTNFYI